MPHFRYLIKDSLKSFIAVLCLSLGLVNTSFSQSQPNLAILNNGNQTMSLIFATDNTTLYNKPSVVCLGSSTFYGLGASNASTTSAVSLISAWLKINCNGGSVIQNLALAGYSTKDIIPGNGNTNYNVEKAASLNPSFVLLSLPSNDALINSTNQWLNNLILIDNYLKARGIVLIIEGTQPRNGLTTAQDQELSDMNTLIGNYFGNRFVNVLNLLRDQTSSSPAVYNPIYNSGDGIHPNDAGHQIIANQFITVLKSYFIPNTNTSWYFQVSSNGVNFQHIGVLPVSSLNATIPIDARYYRFRAGYSDGSYGPFSNVAQYLGYTSATPIPPTANGGAWNFVTIPNQAVFNASASQSASGPLTYSWSKVSGPSGDILSRTDSVILKVSFTQPGTYVYQIKVTDKNGLTGTETSTAVVTASAFTPPLANAGANSTINLPNLGILNGSASKATMGTLVKYHWSKVSGPLGDSIIKPDTLITQVKFTQVGTYIYQILVTDSNGQSSSSSTQIIVNPALLPPTALITGPNSDTLPAQISLNASGSKSNNGGTVVKYLWSKVSGPSGDSLLQPNNSITSVSFTQAGTYVYQVTVTDSLGLSSSSTIQVVVSPSLVPPTANAGNATTIFLPSRATLNASASKGNNASLVKYHWSQISGPNTDTLMKADSIIAKVGFSQTGVYVFQVLVTDNNGLTATSTVQITVNPASTPPYVNGGGWPFLQLPAQATLNASASHGNGGAKIVKYHWSKLSGPSGDVILSPDSMITQVSFTQVGSYNYQITVTDNNGQTASTSLQATVNPASGGLPYANGGGWPSVTLPGVATLNASASRGNGANLVKYHWSKVSGPTGDIIARPDSVITTVSFTQPGVYTYQITVTDSKGQTASITLNATVSNPPAGTLAYHPFSQGIGFLGANLDYIPLDSTYFKNTGAIDPLSIKLFPNPVIGLTHLSFNGYSQGASRIEIYNVQGLQLLSFDFNGLNESLTQSLDLSSLKPGVYSMVIRWSNQYKSIHFLKN